MIDFNNKGFFKLKQNNEYAERVSALLLDDEEVVDAYKAMRDGVVFTTKRIIAVNVQGLPAARRTSPHCRTRTSWRTRWKLQGRLIWIRSWRFTFLRWGR